ncbi:hypothetical protein L209DRAFT_757873 [Thermothelomyces heterothallicus CBS 203.75]
MDAAALLKAQGWRGKGFSLHPTNNAIGLSKPLLISRNTDGRGIGQNKHYTSDQWWLHAFDQKLKGLDTSKKGTVVQSVTQGKLDAVASSQPKGKYTGARGLYASFVRGGMLEGTIEVNVVADGAATTGTAKGESTDATPATSDDGRSEESVSKKEKQSESREERKARRAARRLRKAEKAARKAAEARAAQKAAEKAAKKERKRARKASETKEERRARRAERRARKEERRRKRAEAAQKADQG